MLSNFRRALLACLVSCVGAGLVHAAEGTARPLALADAFRAALAGNPDLKGFVFALRAEQARRQGAALSPAPELSFGVENALGTGDYGGLSSAEATLAISRVIELGGKREARIAAADAAVDAVEVARQAAQLDILAEVARRYVAAAELQERLQLAGRATQLAEGTLEGARRRSEAARAPHVEEDRAFVALEQSRLEARNLAALSRAARRSLAATWGEEGATLAGRPFGVLSGNLYQLPPVEAFPQLLARIKANPAFLRLASEERLLEAQLRLAATRRRSDVSLSGGLRRLQGSGDVALVASFSLPLFAGRRAQSAIDEAAARRDAIDAGREAALVRARAELYALSSDLAEAAAALESLQSTIVPRLEEALKETRYAFERGRYGYLELVDAQRELLDAERSRIDAATRYHLTLIELERLTGTAGER